MNKIQRVYDWRPSPHDPRDFKADLPAQSIPTRFSLRAALPACWDQGQEGSCTGHALAGHMAFFYPKMGKPSPQFIYWNERNLEGTISTDAGAYGRDGCKVVTKLGVCPDTDDVYHDTKWKTKPSAKAFADALLYRAKTYHSLQTLNDMLRNLAAGFPFVFGFQVYDSFESDAVAKTGIMPMPAAGEKPLGGHEVCAVGYDQTRSMLEVRNSWSPSWGDGGYFWMPFEYVQNRKLADDFNTLRL